MRTWHVVQVPEGEDSWRCEVQVAYVPWWAEAVAGFVEFIDAVCTGHLLCGTRFGHELVSWALCFRDFHTLCLHRYSVSAEVGQLLSGDVEE